MGEALTRLVAVGLSHETAPVEIRERMAFDEAGVNTQLKRLLSDNVCDEALLLSTCNRVELYAVPRSEEKVQAYLREFRGPGGESLDRYLYWKRGKEAIQHLFRVTSSLDSQVLGEPQILGQVKDAARMAQEAESLGKLLHRVVDRSFTVAKRVRTETAIGENRVGIGNAGVDLAYHVYGDLRGRRALLIGVGEMGRQVSRALVSAGLEELLVANRTFQRAVELASEHGYTAIAFDRVREYLSRVDIVIACTGARTPVVSRHDVSSSMRARRYEPLLLVDLSVPRNLDPDIAQLDEAYLFNVDDLSQVVEEGKRQREEAARFASRLVQQETDRFITTLSEVNVGPRIGAITQKMEAIRREELERSRKLVSALDKKQKKQLDALTRSLVKKALHDPLLAIRTAAREGDLDTLRALLSVYGVDDDET